MEIYAGHETNAFKRYASNLYASNNIVFNKNLIVTHEYFFQSKQIRHYAFVHNIPVEYLQDLFYRYCMKMGLNMTFANLLRFFNKYSRKDPLR